MKIHNQIIALFLLCCFSTQILGQDDFSQDLPIISNSNPSKFNENYGDIIIPYSYEPAGELIPQHITYNYPTGVDRNGNTAFLQSCINGNAEKYLFVVGSLVDVNESNNHHDTCLHLLAYGGHFAQMLTIREKGGDLALENDDGSTPFDILRMMFIAEKNDAAFIPEIMSLLTIRLLSKTSE